MTHSAPDRCTITLGCTGRLSPLRYTDERQITSRPVVGLTDWSPRGAATQDISLELPEEQFFDTSGGREQQLTMAVELPSPPLDGDVITLKLNARSASIKDYLLYTYNLTSSFTVVGGLESGAALKSLRYTLGGLDPDIVEVFVNGVKRQLGTGPLDYLLYDGTPSSVVAPNTILFNSPVLVNGVSQVDVVVSKAAAADSRSISFIRYEADEARVDSGGWENVSYVERLVGNTFRRFYLFTFDFADDTTLANNTIYFPSGDDPLLNGITPVNLASCFFVLSSPPHTQLDRVITSVVDVVDLNGTLGYFKEQTIGADSRLLLTATVIKPIYPPLRVPVEARYFAEPLLSQSTRGDALKISPGKVVGPAS